MRKHFLLHALALAGLAGTGMTNSAAISRINTVNEVKATEPHQRTFKRDIKISPIGGLDGLLSPNDFGLSPKEYGLRFGNGKSRKHRCNRLKFHQEAKLKKRKLNH